MEEVILLRSLCWSKPARDFKFAAHHRGIAAINRQINIFNHNEGVRSLHIIKKMNQWRPGTLCFDGSKNRLVVWRCFPGTMPVSSWLPLQSKLRMVVWQDTRRSHLKLKDSQIRIFFDLFDELVS